MVLRGRGKWTEGESLEDRFDTDERRAAIAEQKAKMEEKKQAAASA